MDLGRRQRRSTPHGIIFGINGYLSLCIKKKPSLSRSINTPFHIYQAIYLSIYLTIHIHSQACEPKPNYLCRVLFARAPVFGLCFFVSVRSPDLDRRQRRPPPHGILSASTATPTSSPVLSTYYERRTLPYSQTVSNTKGTRAHTHRELIRE